MCGKPSLVIWLCCIGFASVDPGQNIRCTHQDGDMLRLVRYAESVTGRRAPGPSSLHISTHLKQAQAYSCCSSLAAKLPICLVPRTDPEEVCQDHLYVPASRRLSFRLLGHLRVAKLVACSARVVALAQPEGATKKLALGGHRSLLP
jgi:hypothetical protein